MEGVGCELHAGNLGIHNSFMPVYLHVSVYMYIYIYTYAIYIYAIYIYKCVPTSIPL